MATENLCASIKENLNGRPGQPIVLGVCNALASRFNREPWVFRALTIVLGVFWTSATLAAYVLLGLFMHETEQRTRGVFRGLLISIQEGIERLIEYTRHWCGAGPGRDNGTLR